MMLGPGLGAGSFVCVIQSPGGACDPATRHPYLQCRGSLLVPAASLHSLIHHGLLAADADNQLVSGCLLLLDNNLRVLKQVEV